MGFNSAFKGLMPIDFPRQQWLRERATLLRYTYIDCRDVAKVLITASDESKLDHVLL